MKVMNVGTLEPVMVVLGDVEQSQIKAMGGVLLGKFDSQVEKGQKSTWITFDSAYKMGEARLMIERKEV